MDYIYSVLILICLYIILSSSFNLILGYAGLMSVAHPIFFAIGAYTSGLFSIYLDIPILICILLGVLCSSIISTLLAFTSLRVSGDYLLIATIGFQLGGVEVLKNLEFTGGPTGLTGIPPLIVGTAKDPTYLLIVMLIALSTVFSIKWIMKGEYGVIINAMRDDEMILTALGRDVFKIKIVLFTIGCGLAGLAGGFYVHYFKYVNPQEFGLLESAVILTMVVIGGMRTVWGPVIGTVLIISIPQIVRFINLSSSISAPIQGIVYSLLVLLFLFFKPTGILSFQKNKNIDDIERHGSWRT